MLRSMDEKKFLIAQEFDKLFFLQWLLYNIVYDEFQIWKKITQRLKENSNVIYIYIAM